MFSQRCASGGSSGGLLEEGQTPPLLLTELIQLCVSQNLLYDGELLRLQRLEPTFHVRIMCISRVYTECHTLVFYGMATGETPQYIALLDARTELLQRLEASNADPNVLIAKAKDRRVIESVQASAAVAPGQQYAHLVNQVLDAVRSNGEKAEGFVELLEESSLDDIASFLRGKLKEYSARRSTSHRPQSPDHRSSPGSGVTQTNLKTGSVDDSAIDEEMTNTVFVENGSESPAADRAQRKLATVGQSAVAYTSVSGGVVYAEPVSSDNTVTSVEDTQPHSEESASVMAGSSLAVLPETVNMLQTIRDLQAKLAEKVDNEQQLLRQLEAMEVEQKESEEKLKEKERELDQKESQIRELKAQVGHLQEKLRNEKQNNAAEKRRLEEKIEDLERQLKAKEEKFHKEKIDLMEEKFALRLEIQEMHTKEEKLRRQISEEKCKVAELCTQAVEDKTEREMKELKEGYEERLEDMRQKHRNSVSEVQKIKKEIEDLMKNVEPNT